MFLFQVLKRIEHTGERTKEIVQVQDIPRNARNNTNFLRWFDDSASPKIKAAMANCIYDLYYNFTWDLIYKAASGDKSAADKLASYINYWFVYINISRTTKFGELMSQELVDRINHALAIPQVRLGVALQRPGVKEHLASSTFLDSSFRNIGGDAWNVVAFITPAGSFQDLWNEIFSPPGDYKGWRIAYAATWFIADVIFTIQAIGAIAASAGLAAPEEVALKAIFVAAGRALRKIARDPRTFILMMKALINVIKERGARRVLREAAEKGSEAAVKDLVAEVEKRTLRTLAVQAASWAKKTFNKLWPPAFHMLLQYAIYKEPLQKLYSTLTNPASTQEERRNAFKELKHNITLFETLGTWFLGYAGKLGRKTVQSVAFKRELEKLILFIEGKGKLSTREITEALIRFETAVGIRFSQAARKRLVQYLTDYGANFSRIIKEITAKSASRDTFPLLEKYKRMAFFAFFSAVFAFDVVTGFVQEAEKDYLTTQGVPKDAEELINNPAIQKTVTDIWNELPEE